MSAPPELERVLDLLAEALAPRIVDELERRQAAARGVDEAPRRGLLSLAELASELPPSKRPETWRRWLYDHVEEYGGVKVGAAWFFDPSDERLRAILRPTNGSEGRG